MERNVKELAVIRQGKHTHNVKVVICLKSYFFFKYSTVRNMDQSRQSCKLRSSPKHPGKCPLWSSTNTYHCTCTVNKHLGKQRRYSQLIPTGREGLSMGHRLQTLALCDPICHFRVPKSSFNMYLRVNAEVYQNGCFPGEFPAFRNQGPRAMRRLRDVVSESVYTGHTLVFVPNWCCSPMVNK